VTEKLFFGSNNSERENREKMAVLKFETEKIKN